MNFSRNVVRARRCNVCIQNTRAATFNSRSVAISAEVCTTDPCPVTSIHAWYPKNHWTLLWRGLPLQEGDGISKKVVLRSHDSYRIFIYLHLVDSYGKCRDIAYIPYMDPNDC